MGIELRDLTFAYYEDAPDVIDGLSCVLREAETVRIGGGSGCGKSTLGKLLAGILKPAGGSIIIDGEDVTGESPGARSRYLGLAMDDPNAQLICRSVEEEVEMAVKSLGLDDMSIRDRMDHYLGVFGLTGSLDTEPQRLSMGERQMLSLACVLGRQPKYIILDSPVTYLDCDRSMALMKELGRLRENTGCGIIVLGEDDPRLSGHTDRDLDMKHLMRGGAAHV